MKPRTTSFLCLTVIFAGLACGIAQDTAFTYQGRLTNLVRRSPETPAAHHDHESSPADPANGEVDFRFRIFDAASAGREVGLTTTNSRVQVNDGWFQATVDPGPGVLDGSERWLEIAVRAGHPARAEFETLQPRQKLLSTPYAITAANLAGTLPTSQLSGVLPPAALAGNYSNPLNFTNPSNSLAGSGTGLTALNASQLTSGIVPAAALNNAWKTAGNAGTTPGAQFLGTTDNQPLELKVNNQRGLRLEPGVSNSVNVIGGWAGNTVAAGVTGGTIAGGGAGLSEGAPVSNSVAANFGAVSGGAANSILAAAEFANIGGGHFNAIQREAHHSVIGGGSGNTIQPSAPFATIGGGALNTIQPAASFGTIGGGWLNSIQSNSFGAMIGAGVGNNILVGARDATIGGGGSNLIATWSENATIAGGGRNTISTNSHSSTIGGGEGNGIGPDAPSTTIAGGSENRIHSWCSSGFIGGGFGNIIGKNFGAGTSDTIAGGFNNAILDESEASVIAGGSRNRIAKEIFAVSQPTQHAAIGGGSDNVIAGGTSYATIAGGEANSIVDFAEHSTIAGGQWNTIGEAAQTATIGGGSGNEIGPYSEIGTIAGGVGNSIGGESEACVISGGVLNRIGWTSAATISGGGGNYIGMGGDAGTIAGGFLNEIRDGALYSTIGGGYHNWTTANAWFATIPGGEANSATNYAFAAGRRAKAKHTGAFVWGDATDADIASTNANSVTLRAAGGYRFFTDTNATTGVSLAAGDGSWTTLSDVNAKENFRTVNVGEILERVAALPLRTWNYRSQSDGVRHLGPTAQDFKAAFQLGATDTGIATVDADGVALAAIQGLNRKLEEKEAQIARLQSRLEKLEARLGNSTSGE